LSELSNRESPFGAITTDPLLETLGLPRLPGGHRQLGPRYVLIRRVGEGAMGVVYEAWDATLDCTVAVKMPRRPAVQARMDREGGVASVQHPNVVRLRDRGEVRGVPFLVFDYIVGRSVRDLAVPLAEPVALALVAQAAHGLSAVHAEGFVHRDIKPSNLLLGRDGIVRVSDFGLVTPQEPSGARYTRGPIGTPAYMAPEQWSMHARHSAATDLWALGLTLYFLVTGRDAVEYDADRERIDQGGALAWQPSAALSEIFRVLRLSTMGGQPSMSPHR